MTDFFKDCYFNGFCKGRKNFGPTPHYAKKLRAMRHSAEFLTKILFATPRYATESEIQVKNFLVDSSVVDPKLFFPDPIFHRFWIGSGSGSYLTIKKFRIQFRIRP
jgi:hypothetical protein